MLAWLVINPRITRCICKLNYLLGTGYCVLFSDVCKIHSSPRGRLSQSPPSPSRGALRDRLKCEPSLVGLPPTRQGCVMKRAAGHRGPAPPVRVRRTFGVKRYTSSPTGIQMPLAVRAIGWVHPQLPQSFGSPMTIHRVAIVDSINLEKCDDYLRT